MGCDVCAGTPGRYPIINKYGSQLYEIVCPECFGSGLSEDEAAAEHQHNADLAKYMAAMDGTPVTDPRSVRQMLQQSVLSLKAEGGK